VFKVNSLDSDALFPPLSEPAERFRGRHKHRQKVEQDLHQNYTKYGQSTMVFSHEPISIGHMSDLRRYLSDIYFDWFPWDKPVTRTGRYAVNTHTHTYTYRHMHIYTRKHVQILIHMHMHTCVRIHTDTHIGTDHIDKNTAVHKPMRAQSGRVFLWRITDLWCIFGGSPGQVPSLSPSFISPLRSSFTSSLSPLISPLRSSFTSSLSSPFFLHFLSLSSHFSSPFFLHFSSLLSFLLSVLPSLPFSSHFSSPFFLHFLSLSSHFSSPFFLPFLSPLISPLLSSFTPSLSPLMSPLRSSFPSFLLSILPALPSSSSPFFLHSLSLSSPFFLPFLSLSSPFFCPSVLLSLSASILSFLPFLPSLPYLSSPLCFACFISPLSSFPSFVTQITVEVVSKVDPSDPAPFTQSEFSFRINSTTSRASRSAMAVFQRLLASNLNADHAGGCSAYIAPPRFPLIDPPHSSALKPSSLNSGLGFYCESGFGSWVGDWKTVLLLAIVGVMLVWIVRLLLFQHLQQFSSDEKTRRYYSPREHSAAPDLEDAVTVGLLAGSYSPAGCASHLKSGDLRLTNSLKH